MITSLVGYQGNTMPGIPGQILPDTQRNGFVVIHAIEPAQTNIDTGNSFGRAVPAMYVDLHHLKTRMRTTADDYHCIVNVAGSQITCVSVKINLQCDERKE